MVACISLEFRSEGWLAGVTNRDVPDHSQLFVQSLPWARRVFWAQGICQQTNQTEIPDLFDTSILDLLCIGMIVEGVNLDAIV